MPEGYPSKSVQTTVLMEEQEVAFSDSGRFHNSVLPVEISLVEGQTYKVKWDGTEYECVCAKLDEGVNYLGNPSAFGSPATNEPFFLSSRRGESDYCL